MCDLDIHIVLRDREFNKVVEYQSLKADGQVFTIEDAKKYIEQFNGVASRKFFRIYNDNDYDSLKVQPRGGDFHDDESVEKMAVDHNQLMATASLPMQEANCQLVNISLADMERKQTEQTLKMHEDMQSLPKNDILQRQDST